MSTVGKLPPENHKVTLKYEKIQIKLTQINIKLQFKRAFFDINKPEII